MRTAYTCVRGEGRGVRVDVPAMDVASMRSLVSFKPVCLSFRNPSYPLCVVFNTLKSSIPEVTFVGAVRLTTACAVRVQGPCMLYP